jgi:subtilisin family serine protease
MMVIHLVIVMVMVHTAGTVGGTRTGIAPTSNIYALRVLNCEGTASFSTVISAINWVATNRVVWTLSYHNDFRTIWLDYFDCNIGSSSIEYVNWRYLLSSSE